MAYYDEFDGALAGRILNAATNRVRAAYYETFGEKLVDLQGAPRARFDYALRRFQQRIKDGPATLSEEAREASNATTLLNAIFQGIDYVSPAEFKDVVWGVCETLESDEVALRTFMQRVYSDLAARLGWSRRLYVKENADFARSWQWLQECCDEWLDYDGNPIVTFHNARRGPVARIPRPDNVRVRVNLAYFKE